MSHPGARHKGRTFFDFSQKMSAPRASAAPPDTGVGHCLRLVDGGEAELVVVVALLFFHDQLAKLALAGVELGGGRIAQAG